MKRNSYATLFLLGLVLLLVAHTSSMSVWYEGHRNPTVHGGDVVVSKFYISKDKLAGYNFDPVDNKNPGIEVVYKSQTGDCTKSLNKYDLNWGTISFEWTIPKYFETDCPGPYSEEVWLYATNPNNGKSELLYHVEPSTAFTVEKSQLNESSNESGSQNQNDPVQDCWNRDGIWNPQTQECVFEQSSSTPHDDNATNDKGVVVSDNSTPYSNPVENNTYNESNQTNNNSYFKETEMYWTLDRFTCTPHAITTGSVIGFATQSDCEHYRNTQFLMIGGVLLVFVGISAFLFKRRI